MKNTAQDFKVRLRKTGTEKWRYALTITRNGQIMSSTFNMNRANKFTEKEVAAVSLLKSVPNGIYKETDVEVF